jgi:hypothetical protein
VLGDGIDGASEFAVFACRWAEAAAAAPPVVVEAVKMGAAATAAVMPPSLRTLEVRFASLRPSPDSNRHSVSSQPRVWRRYIYIHLGTEAEGRSQSRLRTSGHKSNVVNQSSGVALLLNRPLSRPT